MCLIEYEIRAAMDENKKPKKRNRLHTSFVVVLLFVFIIFLLFTGIIYIPIIPRNLSAHKPAPHEGKTIYILPLDDIDDESLTYIRNFIASDSNLPVVVIETFPIPKEAWGRKDQVDADYLMNLLQTISVPKDTFRIIGLTSADLYIRDWNFIFGQADLMGLKLVISLYRMRPRDENGNYIEKLGGQYLKLYHTRLRKIFRHEIGHTFHLRHCWHPWCVMQFAISLTQQDKQGEYFCPFCSWKMVNKKKTF
jgi:archaemetzincin